MDQLEKQLDNKEFQEIGSMVSFKVLETQFHMFTKSRIYLDDEYVVMTSNYFLQYTQLKIPEFRDTLIQHMESVKKSIDKRALHKREYDSWVNERQMQTTEEKPKSRKLDIRLWHAGHALAYDERTTCGGCFYRALLIPDTCGNFNKVYLITWKIQVSLSGLGNRSLNEECDKKIKSIRPNSFPTHLRNKITSFNPLVTVPFKHCRCSSPLTLIHPVSIQPSSLIYIFRLHHLQVTTPRDISAASMRPSYLLLRIGRLLSTVTNDYGGVSLVQGWRSVWKMAYRLL
nr:hypothetical protein [Tanacetum cinerariifolium]